MQVVGSRERVEDLLGEAVGEVLVVIVRAEVVERQNGDRLVKRA